MYFSDKVVSRDFRAELIKTYPQLGNNTAYWRMLQYILFGHWCGEDEEDSKTLLVPRILLASMENSSADNNYSARSFLEAFRRDIFPYRIVEHKFSWDNWASRARRIADYEVDERIAELAKLERRSNDLDRVWMSDGTTYLRKHSVQQRQDQLADIWSSSLFAQYPENTVTGMLVRYMNSLASNRFTSSGRNIDAAIELADEMGANEQQYNILLAMRSQPQPLYLPGLKTVRIFSANESALRLKRQLRKVITSGWIEADLKSAQLAIVAKVWPVPGLADYLRDGTSIWKDLCEHMALPFNDNNKSVMKSALYALIFGAGAKKMRMCLSEDFADSELAYKIFTKHTVINELLKARTRQLKAIRDEQGAYDAFGSHLEYQTTYIGQHRYQLDNSRSILARVAQSYELKLLTPVIEEAMRQRDKSHGFSCTTWLHDGFTFAPHHSGDVESWKERLRSLVAKQAKEMLIFTELEI